MKKMVSKILFSFSFLVLSFLFIQNSNAQSIIFSSQVNSDCVPTGTSKTFSMGSSGAEVCCIVNLKTETSENTSVTFDIFKNGVNDFSNSLDIPARTNCFWQKLILKVPAEWTVRALDSNGNIIASGTITVTE